MPVSLVKGRAGFYALPIFLSASLLFTVEPLMAKRIVPWFGGSAAVWTTCLVFYQAALLAGYLYAALLARVERTRVAAGIHLAMLAAAVLFLAIGLPSGAGDAWTNADVGHPTRSVLWLLVTSIGLPFCLLASTSPLLQHWAAEAGETVPYRLFAISNLASLCALLAYPTLIEPFIGLSVQRLIWSVLFGCYVLSVLPAALAVTNTRTERIEPESYLLPTRRLAWFALSACGSVLLLAVTNHITENVAAVPLLWVLPLAVYLLTFIVAFAPRKPMNRALWLRLLAFALGVLGYSIYQLDVVEAIQISLPVFLAGLFICCRFCHGELHRLRPEPKHLTDYYLSIAAGGAAGAVFVGLIAPQVFGGVYELPVALTATGTLAAILVWQESAWTLRLLWIGVTGCMAATVVSNVHAYHENTLSLRRSFYGSLRVVQSPHAGPEQLRTLYHGAIEHGSQYLQLPGRLHATSYYGRDSGIGVLLREYPKTPKRVGLVGLGAGTLAAYGRAGDTFRFFEINGQIIDIAQSLFWYTRESRARTEIRQGDGRLALARDTGAPYDILVLDAFSGDAIPVHLLTAQAMEIYRSRLLLEGVLAVHVSNDFLDLAPVVFQLARRMGWSAILVHNHGEPDNSTLPADWVLVSRNREILSNSNLVARSQPVAPRPSLRLWTDDYNSLFEIVKAPTISFSTLHSQ